jgi:metallo-beta-lactamase class B
MSNAAPFWKQPWTLRGPAFAITDRLLYVGNRNVSCHLLRAEGGLVLIDTAFAQTTYLLTESIRSVGFDPTDIDLVIHSHGHVDHCGATRRMKELSGASAALGVQDVATVEQGTKYTCAERLYGIPDFENFEVDRPLRHGDTIDLGDTVIECHHTPGHTPGVISYTFEVEAEGKRVMAGMFGGPGLWTLTDEHRQDQGYPENREDFARSLQYLKGLEVDVWLGAHPNQNDTFGKFERLRAGDTPNPFIDPDGWRQFVSDTEASFEKLLEQSARERRGSWRRSD